MTGKDPTRYGFTYLLPGTILLLLVFVIPIALFLSRSVLDPRPTSEHFLHIFENPVYLRVLWVTFRISFTVTVVCILLGYPIAYLLSTVSDRARNLLMILVLIPFWTSLLVRNYAWMVLLGRQGVINNILVGIRFSGEPLKLLHTAFAVNVGMIQMMMPFMILSMFSVMKGIDRRLVSAALSLGANRIKAFFKVYFPLSLPGVGAGSLLVFIYSLGFFITPALLGGRKDVMISMLIEEQVSTMLNWGFASALALLLLACTFLFFFIYTRFFKIEQIF
ncbi:MAG: ABC transporter permease [Spirochaetaceae bacterium]|nr:MAG: ABC transporter permease [Spirochaetaceae bacterium]